jgi:hypothetical protein
MIDVTVMSTPPARAPRLSGERKTMRGDDRESKILILLIWDRDR